MPRAPRRSNGVRRLPASRLPASRRPATGRTLAPALALGLGIAAPCLLAGPAAGALAAGDAATVSFDAPDVDRWFYPFNASPGVRAEISVFGVFGEPTFDNRDGQMILRWATDPAIPAGLGPDQYDVLEVVVTVQYSNDLVTMYDPTVDPWTVFVDPDDPDFTPDADPGQPIELFGVGGRNDADPLTYAENGAYSPFGAFGKGIRNLFAADFESGEAIDVSNSVDEGVTPQPWAIGLLDDVAPGDPIPQDSLMRFSLDVADPDVQAYLRASLDAGALPVALTSLTFVEVMGGSFPTYYAKENVLVELGLASAATISITWQENTADPCPADLDASGSVDFGDLLSVLGNWGACASCPEDLDGSGAVDFGDLLTVLSAWGPCPG